MAFRGIFVTGTDTGVGKTLIAGGLAAVLRDRGVDVGVMKPVESGCRRQNGRLIPEDALFLRDMAQCTDDMSLVNIYALERPLAPALAAEIEKVKISKSRILKAVKALLSRHEFVIVEGVGGLLVPLYGNYFVAGLAKDLNLPIVIVSRASLGAINHSLLTLSFARSSGIKIKGLVMNHTSADCGEAEAMSPAAIKRWGKSPLLGVIPFLIDKNRDSIAKAVRENINMDALLSP